MSFLRRIFRWTESVHKSEPGQQNVSIIKKANNQSEKDRQYMVLVQKRKVCHICKGLTNPGDFKRGNFDSDQIGPWSLWQHDLNADLMIVGQDWGDTKYFEKWGGRDQNDGNPTNKNLQELLKSIGIIIGKPRDEQKHHIFMTNLILCLKEGGLQAPVSDEWFSLCTKQFFKPLVEIIRPMAILALGERTSKFILNAYEVNYRRNASLKTMIIEHSPFKLTSQILLFPLYHCGAMGINRNRTLKEQLNDWQNIKRFL
jgi:uracil-DNA glycosylase family 4